jgi:uncharacterized protein (DUF2461 family)
MPRATPAAARFEGFADTEMKLFRALAKHNDREWFAKHKAEYEEGWAKPMAALLAEAKERVDAAYPHVEIGDPKVFRIQRDVRFSADKSPYKTQVSGMLPARTGKSAMEAPAALYLQLGVEAPGAQRREPRDQGGLGGGAPQREAFAAAGLYATDAPTLARYRAAVLDDAKGPELAKMVRALEKKGYSTMAAESLKSAPRGVDPSHPRIDLLKMKGLAVTFPPLPTDKLGSRAIVDWLVAEAKRVAPLVSWLVLETS